MANATDARISVALPGHPKTKKLARRLGDAGPLHCIYLFLWTAANRSDGDLAGMSDEDIELAINWTGEDNAFVSAMTAVGFLDGDEGERRIHDWSEHNAWAAGADDRSQRAKFAALCRDYGRAVAINRMPEYAAGLPETTRKTSGGGLPDKANGSNSDSSASSGSSTGQVQDDLKDAGGSSPSPILTDTVSVTDTPPSQKDEPTVVGLPTADGDAAAADGADLLGKVPKKQIPNCPHLAIIGLYHEILPEMPGVVSWEEDRRKWLAARWKADPERQNLDWWRAYFEAVRGMPWLMGERAGRDGNTFKCSLEWLIRPKNFAKVIEGTYVDMNR